MVSLKKMIVTSLAVTTLLPTAVLPIYAQSVIEETYSQNEEKAQDPNLTEDALSENDGLEFDDEGKLVSITIGGEKAEILTENPGTGEAPVNNTPNRISTNLSEDSSTSMLFQWHTTDPDDAARLYVWKEGESLEDAVEFTPELVEIKDAIYSQETEDGHHIFAIMWDEEEDEPYTDDDDPGYPINNPDKVLGYYTDEAFTADNLLWLDKGFDEYSLILPYPEFTETAYKAEATDLEPATTYHYVVGNKEGELSAEGQFTTAAADKEDFTFIHYADTQNAFSSENQRSEADYSRSVVESMLANEDAKDALFAVHSGDVVNDDWNDTEWNLTLDALAPLVEAMPHLFVTGNHDNANFLDHLNTPQALEEMTSGAAYATRYNGVQFITLNTEQANESDEDVAPMIANNQMAWFKDQLEAAQQAKEAGEIDWIIVNYHRPLYSSSYHPLEDENVQLSREELMETLDEYDVDAVLNGHDHNLTVTQSLVYDPEVFGKASVAEEGTTDGDTTEFKDRAGTVFFVPSTAGTKTYDAIYKNQTFEWLMEEEDINETFEELFDYEVTEDDIQSFRQLLLLEDQPFRSPFYTSGHSNARESNIQNYFVVDVTEDALTFKLFEVVGEDLSNRETQHLHTYIINK